MEIRLCDTGIIEFDDEKTSITFYKYENVKQIEYSDPTVCCFIRFHDDTSVRIKLESKHAFDLIFDSWLSYLTKESNLSIIDKTLKVISNNLTEIKSVLI